METIGSCAKSTARVSIKSIFKLVMEDSKKKCLTGVDASKLSKAADILKSIAHPGRMAILELLCKSGEANVSQIIDHVGLEQSVVSNHLRLMKDRGVLEHRREGKMVFYTLKIKKMANIIECMETMDLD